MRFLEQARMSPQQTDLCITGIDIIYIYTYTYLEQTKILWSRLPTNFQAKSSLCPFIRHVRQDLTIKTEVKDVYNQKKVMICHPWSTQSKISGFDEANMKVHALESHLGMSTGKGYNPKLHPCHLNLFTILQNTS